MQSTIPVTVGISTERAVTRKLLLSFFIVRTVVEQGQWNMVKIIVQSAVDIVQPFETSIFFSSARLSYSINMP